MFQQLSDRLTETVRKVRGQARLTEDNISDALRQIRVALLEADVSLPVARSFINEVREKAIGAEVNKNLNPGQVFIKIVNDELTNLLGEQNESLNFKAQPPVVILMAGLQGAGKTTTSGKLARFLKERAKKNVAMVSADVYRPAAIKQLETVARQVDAQFIESNENQNPVDIAKGAVETAKRSAADVLIIDTAGRLHVDETLMDEVASIQEAVTPTETLFVVDSMTGQDAVNSAKAFGDALDLTGVVLSKADGDSRGGAALSIRQITGVPIKFLGMGEGMEALEAFYPDRLANRILGMGDVVGLVEEVQQKMDVDKAQQMAGKVLKSGQFDLTDFRDQIMQMQQMGGLGTLMEKMPGADKLPQGVDMERGEREMGRVVAIINSMTPNEREHPDLIKASRKRRIAAGSGTQVQDVNRLLKQFNEMRKMMKKMKGKGMMKMMQRMKGMGGGKFPGMPF